MLPKFLERAFKKNESHIGKWILERDEWQMSIKNDALRIRKMIVDANINLCKGISPEQMEMIIGLYQSYKEMENNIKRDAVKFVPSKASEYAVEKKAPLLQIELDTYGSVPRVIHKGEEIELKQSIQFDWDPSEDTLANGPYIKIRHIEKGMDISAQKTIEYRDPFED